MKKLFVLLFSIFLLQTAGAYASEKSYFEMPADSVLTRLAISGARTGKALDRDTIGARCTDREHHRIVISPDTSVLLILYCDSEFEHIRTAAEAYFTTDPDNESYNVKRGQMSDETLFRKVCQQLIYTLNVGIAKEEAHRILKKLGTYDKYLDCVQREVTYGKYTYVMKLSREGVLVMAVSHV